jgi:hypothetical protein
LIQILHHAYVFNFRYILLLIGDSKSQVINGLWVRFDDELKDAYGKLLKEIYSRCLKWAYEPDAAPITEDKVMKAVKHSKQLKGRLDWESFQGHFSLWRYVSNKIPGPLPSIDRILPFVFSTWNCLKGGSDTITKLIWFANTCLPCDSPQVCILIVDCWSLKNDRFTFSTHPHIHFPSTFTTYS